MPYNKDSAVREITEIIDRLDEEPNKELLFGRLVARNTTMKQLVIMYGIKAEGYALSIKVIKGTRSVWERIHPYSINVRYILKAILKHTNKVEA